MTLLRRALFGTPGNALLSLLTLAFFVIVGPRVWHWAVQAASWDGASRRDCQPDGACWAFIRARFGLFLYGRYPVEERWRVDLAVAGPLALFLAAALARRGRWLLLVCTYVAAPVVATILLAGGVAGLATVPTADWGGLALNVVLSSAAFAGAVPIGILLAFGRRSSLPAIRWGSTALVEFWRGVPLLAVLFMGLVLLPLFLPGGATVDAFLRALVVLTLFEAAYVAETVRGALQGIQAGQAEAAQALGLRPAWIHLLIELPQALRIALPGLVGIAIDLFKDTTLVSIVGLFDLLGVVMQSLRDPAWQGLAAEGYVFAAGMFFACCALISAAGGALERRLAAAHSRR